MKLKSKIALGIVILITILAIGTSVKAVDFTSRILDNVGTNLKSTSSVFKKRNQQSIYKS